MKRLPLLLLLTLTGTVLGRTLEQYEKSIDGLHSKINKLHAKYKGAQRTKKQIPYNETLQDLKQAKQLKKQALTLIDNRGRVEQATAETQGNTMALGTYSAAKNAKRAIKKLKPVVKNITRAQRNLT